MRELSPEEVVRESVADLGLDADALDIDSREAIAALLRRAGAFLCPCPKRVIQRAVSTAIRGLVREPEKVEAAIEETFDAQMNYGDFLELEEVRTDEQGSKRLIYAAPPAFIIRESGAAVLVGIAPENSPIVPEKLLSQVESVNHIRRLLGSRTAEETKELLLNHGLIELSMEYWTKAPRQTSAEEVLQKFGNLLRAAPESTEIPGLKIIDPQVPRHYYKGRWRDPERQTGTFVGRRQQKYGANLWCFVELNNGEAKRFLDLPVKDLSEKPWDQAWYLQMALDARRGEPQFFRLRKGPGEKLILDFFGPIPSWAQRRLDAVLLPVPSSGCLFSYVGGKVEIEEEIEFTETNLWMQKQVARGGGTGD